MKEGLFKKMLAGIFQRNSTCHTCFFKKLLRVMWYPANQETNQWNKEKIQKLGPSTYKNLVFDDGSTSNH